MWRDGPSYRWLPCLYDLQFGLRSRAFALREVNR